jgi:hypothetical protein
LGVHSTSLGTCQCASVYEGALWHNDRPHSASEICVHTRGTIWSEPVPSHLFSHAGHERSCTLEADTGSSTSRPCKSESSAQQAVSFDQASKKTRRKADTQKNGSRANAPPPADRHRLIPIGPVSVNPIGGRPSAVLGYSDQLKCFPKKRSRCSHFYE